LPELRKELHMKRKLLSVLLAVVLVAGLPVSSAFADEVGAEAAAEIATVADAVDPNESLASVAEPVVETSVTEPTPSAEEAAVQAEAPSVEEPVAIEGSSPEITDGIVEEEAVLPPVLRVAPETAAIAAPHSVGYGGYGATIGTVTDLNPSDGIDPDPSAIFVVKPIIIEQDGYERDRGDQYDFILTAGQQASDGPVLNLEFARGVKFIVTVPSGDYVLDTASSTATDVELPIPDGDVVMGTFNFLFGTAAVSTTKDITSFELAGATGAISGANINVGVPYGTDLTALTPAVVHNGVSISPSGPQDFSSPVTYTVTAQDSGTKAYTITVAVSTVVPVSAHFGTWDGKGTATAKAEADLSKFVQLTLDGKAVDPANYSTASGSTIITLSESYLKTLANGSYAFTAVFTDGTAALPLTVNVQPESTTPPPATGGGKTTPAGGLPQTGDNSLPILWAALLFISGGGGLILFARRRFLLG
jgi:LPXTG-motif cell wall-anchored protein